MTLKFDVFKDNLSCWKVLEDVQRGEKIEILPDQQQAVISFGNNQTTTGKIVQSLSRNIGHYIQNKQTTAHDTFNWIRQLTDQTIQEVTTFTALKSKEFKGNSDLQTVAKNTLFDLKEHVESAKKGLERLMVTYEGNAENVQKCRELSVSINQLLENEIMTSLSRFGQSEPAVVSYGAAAADEVEDDYDVNSSEINLFVPSTLPTFSTPTINPMVPSRDLEEELKEMVLTAEDLAAPPLEIDEEEIKELEKKE